jgi:predicted nucleic acid-binding protein
MVAAALRQARKPKIIDTWFAATAVTHDLAGFPNPKPKRRPGTLPGAALS